MKSPKQVKVEGINFTPAQLTLFRRAHRQAMEQGQDVFTFQGHKFLREYSCYLIRYLERLHEEFSE